MKKIDLKKTGILLVMMLVASAILVGPVSAGSVTERSDYGFYDVTANGNALSQTSLSYYGKAVTVSGDNSDLIIVDAVLYGSGGNYINRESKTKDNTNRVFTNIGQRARGGGGLDQGKSDGGVWNGEDHRAGGKVEQNKLRPTAAECLILRRNNRL